MAEGSDAPQIHPPAHFRLETLRGNSWELVGHGEGGRTRQFRDILIVHLADRIGPVLQLRPAQVLGDTFTAQDKDGGDALARYRFVDSIPFSDIPQRYGRFWKAVRREEEERLTPKWTPPREWASNPHIVTWWSAEHDALLKGLISDHGWAWEAFIDPSAIRDVNPGAYELWLQTDPLCEEYADYNLIRNFAIARSAVAGLDRELPESGVRECAACHNTFDTAGVRADLLVLGGEELCGACIYKAFIAEGDQLASAEEVAVWIREIVEVLKRIPSQAIVAGRRAAIRSELPSEGGEEWQRALCVLPRKPAQARIKDLFGSWFEALVESGVVDRAGQRLSRGTRCLAEDGHVCWSIGEKTIDDMLFRAEIAHEREPSYPEGGFRADFKIGDALIEFLGLAGNPDYDAKTKRKREIAATAGIQLVEVYADDLADLKRLTKRLAALTTPR
jgi:hypothetical protein